MKWLEGTKLQAQEIHLVRVNRQPLATQVACQITCEEDDEKLPFKYSHLGLHIIQTDKTALGGSLSVPLPGSLYVVLERKAEEIDNDDYSYERIINAARIGVHAGIADVLSCKCFELQKFRFEKASCFEKDICKCVELQMF